MADGSGANVSSVSASGDRGVVGTGTAGSRLKNLHRAQPGNGLSLKAFAKTLESKSTDVLEWYENKGPARENNAKALREKKKGAVIKAQALASKQARTKKK